MESCPICYETKPLITVHLSCKFCDECAFAWLQNLTVNQRNIDIDSYATCPTQGCAYPETMKTFSSNLPQTRKEQLNDIFLRKYILTKSDILQCPNSSSLQPCDYAGYTIESHFGCRTPFSCEKCGLSWTHPITRWIFRYRMAENEKLYCKRTYN